MLKVPAFEYFDDMRVTVYQDDAQFWKFYLIPDFVSIRRDVDGDPVFLLVKYAFSDEDREENPDLADGGGYLAMDVELSVPEADATTIRERLQEHVDQTWRRMKQAAESQGSNVQGARIRTWFYKDGQRRENQLGVDDLNLGLNPEAITAPPGDEPPKVRIDYPTWVSGTFALSAPQSDELVSNRVANGPVSLVGKNVAAANMDLTEAGATFMRKTLVEEGGGGATDITPIQARYDLKFWARIPPVRLNISADSRKIYMALKEVMHDFDRNACSPNDMETYESELSMMVKSGIIEVDLDTGTLELESDFVQELNRFALEVVKDLIKDTFFEKQEEGEGEDDGDDEDVSNEKKDIYRLKIMNDFSSVHFEYNQEMTHIREWRVVPQGTLQSFFADMPEEEIEQYVRVVDLTDPFFQSLNLTVNAFADFANEPIEFVEAQVRYTGENESGEDVEKVETFTFTDGDTSKTWDPRLIGGKRSYEYRWRVGFEGREPGAFTDWEEDTTPNLNLSVEDPGKISIEVRAGQIDFDDTVDKVHVTLLYEDLADDIEKEEHTLVLSSGQESQTYERMIFTEMDEPVRYRSTFFLQNGERIETDEQEMFGNQLTINEPEIDKLEVRLIPTWKPDAVSQVVVSLRYEDEANDFRTEKTFNLTSPDDFKTWTVLLRDSSLRSFEYKTMTTYADGTFEESDWQREDGPPALPIKVKQPDAPETLAVNINPALIDFEVVPIVEVTLRYEDEANDVREVDTFTFTSKEEEETWEIEIADERKRAYTAEITYHLRDGRAVELDPQELDDESLILERPPVPEIVCTLVPQLIDFEVTPVVEAHFDYEDPEHGIDETATRILTSAESKTVRIPVHEDSPEEYSLQFTYFEADGDVVEKEPVTTTKKRKVVPKLVSSES